MIPVQDVVNRIASILDAEGSDRYLFDQDYKPAINSSKDWIVAVFKRVFSDKIVSEENLRELVAIRVFQTNKFSRIKIDESVIGDDVWSILSINPEAVTYPNNTILPVANDFDSLYRNDLTYIESDYSAKRLTIEEWENMKKNVFLAGNPTIQNNFKSYSYLNLGDYSSQNYNPGASEIEISPKVENDLVGVRYLKYPKDVVNITDNLEFPRSVFEMIVQKAANFMSFKQGDQTNLYSVTKADINTLTQLMI